MTTYFGFAVSDSMFSGNCEISRRTLDAREFVQMMHDTAGIVPCVNPSHVATLEALKMRYDVHISVPSSPPRVSLQSGDSLIVMGVRGLPRLTDRHEYTEAEISGASFSFSVWEVK